MTNFCWRRSENVFNFTKIMAPTAKVKLQIPDLILLILEENPYIKLNQIKMPHALT